MSGLELGQLMLGIKNIWWVKATHVEMQRFHDGEAPMHQDGVMSRWITEYIYLLGWIVWIEENLELCSSFIGQKIWAVDRNIPLLSEMSMYSILIQRRNYKKRLTDLQWAQESARDRWMIHGICFAVFPDEPEVFINTRARYSASELI